MPKVLISDELSPAAVEIFKNRGIEVDFQPQLGPDAAKLKEIIGNYDGLAIRSATKVKADIIAAATNLKVIGRAGIGVDNVDIPAATAKGIVVMNTPFGNSITTAEHAIALMFAAARQIGAADASTQAGKWEKNRFNGVELYAKTLGLIGCGNIGSLVAERGLGLKMKVVAYDPFLSPERAIELGVEKVELEELLKRADFISLHTPMTEKTKNILSAENIAKTKKGVVIVNAARGGLVDEIALRAALESGHVAAAGFDVFTVEPAKENVLFGAPNFIATPHLGASTTEAQENVALQVAEQMADYLLDRRCHQRAQPAVDHGGRSAAPEAVRRAGGKARHVRGPDRRRRPGSRRDRIRRRSRRAQHQAADGGRARGPDASADAGREHGLGAGGAEGKRHGAAGDPSAKRRRSMRALIRIKVKTGGKLAHARGRGGGWPAEDR